MIDLSKAMIAIRYWLLAKEYYKVLEAMEWAFENHTGFRKDGKTPAFSHQISVAFYLRTICHNLTLPEETLATAFLHDLSEDCGKSIQEIKSRFGDTIATSVRILDKHQDMKNDKSYYFQIARDPIASIVKASDRIHNVQTMIGVFTREKQKGYIKETQEFVIPMIKQARRMFPQQEPSYENAKHMLKCQIQLIEAIHGSSKGI